MLRAIIAWYARWRYIFSKEQEAGLNEWNARVSEQKAKESRNLILTLKQSADEFDARIKQMAEMEERGFYLCEDGHETPGPTAEQIADASESNGPFTMPNCAVCNKPNKFIKRSEMNGQEKYESDKDRKDAEKLLAGRREEIATKEDEANQQDATDKYFRQQSESSRKLAESLRQL